MDLRHAELVTVDDLLETLADPTRRAVVEALSRRPCRAGELAGDVGVSPQVMSRHLRVLRERQFIHGHTSDDDSRVRIYTLRPERLEDLRSWLDAMQGFWSDQLASFARGVAKP